MSDKHTADSRQQTGADGSSAPVGEAEVVDGEVVVDAEVVEEAEAPSEPEAEAVEPDPLAEALRERGEYLDLAQRARADFENYRRRTSAQISEADLRGRATLARGLLPAIDNLQRALAGAEADATDAHADDAFTKGVGLVYGELRAALERAGVVAFDPTGERFDPNLHEAISTAPAEGVEAGKVLETLELGFRVDQQVIRPARVVVSG